MTRAADIQDRTARRNQRATDRVAGSVAGFLAFDDFDVMSLGAL